MFYENIRIVAARRESPEILGFEIRVLDGQQKARRIAPTGLPVTFRFAAIQASPATALVRRANLRLAVFL